MQNDSHPQPSHATQACRELFFSFFALWYPMPTTEQAGCGSDGGNVLSFGYAPMCTMPSHCWRLAFFILALSICLRLSV